MKKIISILLTAELLMCGAACSKNEEEGGKTSEVPTLTWLIPGDKQPDIASVMAEANKITEAKIGARLDIQFIDTGSFSERMKMNMAAGEDFDLCFSGWVNPYTTAVKNGGLMDITEMIDAHPSLKETLPDYAWEAATIDGRVYGVPNLQIMATGTSLVIQKAIADKYDFDWSTVKHINDIEPFLEMVKEGEPNLYPYRTNYGMQAWREVKWEGLSGGYVIARDGSSSEIKLFRDTEEFKDAQETLRRWYQKGYIRQDVLSAGDDTADEKAGKYVISTAVTKPGLAEISKQLSGRDVIVVEVVEPYLQKSKCLATLIAIGANSKNPEKAMDFIELVNTDTELYNLICFGIEGKHYNLNEEGKVVYVEGSGYAPKADWKFGNQFNAMLTEGMDDNIWEETARINNEARKSPVLKFQFDSDPVRSQISQYSAIGDEFNVMNHGADIPENYMNEWIQKCEAAGEDAIGEELQKQINEFWANK